MASTKHTPGPWYLSPLGLHIRAEGVHGWNIATVEDQPPYTEANAKLLAAAPELLAQLRASVEITRVWHGMGAYGSEIENRMWKIYYTMSPEMRPIRELLGKLESL